MWSPKKNNFWSKQINSFLDSILNTITCSYVFVEHVSKIIKTIIMRMFLLIKVYKILIDKANKKLRSNKWAVRKEHKNWIDKKNKDVCLILKFDVRGKKLTNKHRAKLRILKKFDNLLSDSFLICAHLCTKTSLYGNLKNFQCFFFFFFFQQIKLFNIYYMDEILYYSGAYLFSI